MAATWEISVANELRRLSNGIPGRIKGTKAIFWITKKQVPKGKKLTYTNMVYDYRPLKDKNYRVRLTIGVDNLVYHDETASSMANLLDINYC